MEITEKIEGSFGILWEMKWNSKENARTDFEKKETTLIELKGIVKGTFGKW
jgi:hypothetical protein